MVGLVIAIFTLALLVLLSPPRSCGREHGFVRRPIFSFSRHQYLLKLSGTGAGLCRPQRMTCERLYFVIWLWTLSKIRLSKL